jgi:hypothetical protein
LGEAAQKAGAEPQLGSLRVTANHPIFMPESRSWIPAGAVQAGAELLVRDGKHTSRARSAGFDETDARIETVYDITVEGQHNFFAAGVLVHNKSYAPTGGAGGTGGIAGTGGSGLGGNALPGDMCWDAFYETPLSACSGSFAPPGEDDYATLTVPAGQGGAAGGGNAELGGEGGEGGASDTNGPSAEAAGELATTCSDQVRWNELRYEKPAVPYRIDVWGGDALCERGSLLVSATGDGSDAGRSDTLVLPEMVVGENWTGAWSVQVTSTTGAELSLRFRVYRPVILP